MKLFVRSLLLGSLGLSAAIAGRPAAAADPACNGPGCVPEATTEAKEHHHHGGMIGEALRQLDLTPDQQIAAGAIKQMVMSRKAEVRAAKHGLLLGLADQLEAGKVDAKAVAPQIAAYVLAESTASPVEHAAFEALHNILTPEQRVKFADVIEQRIDKRSEKFASGAWLDKVGEALGLTDQQKEQVKDEVKSFEPTMTAHRDIFKRVLEAFKGDTFSMTLLIPSFDPAAHATQVAATMVKATEKAVSILTPEQRKIAAEKIRERLGAGERPAAPTGVTVPTAPAPAHTGQSVAPLEEDVGSSEDAQLVAPIGVPLGATVGTAFPGTTFVSPGTSYMSPIPGGFAYGFNNPGIGYSYSVPGASGYSYSSGSSSGYVTGFPSFGLTPFGW